MTSKYNKTVSLSHCVLTPIKQQAIAVHCGEVIEHARFKADVSHKAAAFSKLKNNDFALYYEQAYPFCVNLFALLHSQKKIWIAGNNKSATAEQLTEQGCLLLGDWEGKETSIVANKTHNFELTALNLNTLSITIYTSGSSGQAKAINKTLQQFQCEIETLEQYWGAGLGDAQVLATVSHQHIYGLLFRILWPLAAGRCFHSEMYLSPEPLLKAAHDIPTYWVASPAQLKRLDELTPWQQIAKLNTLFSSGGALPITAATQISQNCGHKVIEVYGSSETGGIAWRKSVDEQLWTTFDGITVSVDKGGQSYLSSPYLAKQGEEGLTSPALDRYKMDDKIKLSGNNQFELLGRLDRIVKIEEKRLSLDELEQAFNKSAWVQQSYALLLAGKRDKIAVVLVLTESGEAVLKQGRAGLIKQLRKQLMHCFETVVLPKKWLFMQSLPITTQGKIDRALLVQLLSLDPLRLPQIVHCNFQDLSVEIQCRVLPRLIYFSGHFPQQPILPGVTQLAWAEQLAKIFFPISMPFLRMEVIKFKKIIQPGDNIKINLHWKAAAGKLYFELSSMADSHSSGRIVYGEKQ